MFQLYISSSRPTLVTKRPAVQTCKTNKLSLFYKPRKGQRSRRRRFSLTKFIFLLSNPLVYFYKTKLSKKLKKARFYKFYNKVRFGHIAKKQGQTLLKYHNSMLRHLEINKLVHGFTVLPIPYIYFYSFLLDQTFLWKSILIEMQLYYR
jgi:hypothetical protein